MITDYLPVDPMVILAYALAALTLVIAAGPGQGLVLTQTIESGARASLLTSLALQTPLLSRRSRSNNRARKLWDFPRKFGRASRLNRRPSDPNWRYCA